MKMTPKQQRAWNEWNKWLATRPENVRQMALKFPPGTAFMIHEQPMYLIGYRESGSDVLLLVSDTDPGVDYKTAMSTGQPICPCCIPEMENLKIT